MRKLLESNRLILVLYGCLLVSLASFFIIREQDILHQIHHELPLMFLVRFGVFWFVSLMIAIVLYLVHLSYYHLFLKSPDRTLARRVGYLTFWLGVGGGTLITVLLYLYHEYPDYFYL
ncbi:hypothetical protein H8S95_00560 [Pontibacter sp. KCTC 32443]|uniref:hypothetical protein n=1 Tax=Pontibacter TaxID=323449 RepID=UPI00164D8BC3|nr:MULTISPECIES: hypothetical protein [Pontibacter]MBC5772540.1 hypothetical protein [Pontibacter sp. KCTC 32443]